MVGHIEILFKKLDPNAVIPCYIHEGDSGLDLCSLHEYIIKPGECTLVETGLSAEVISHGDLTSFTFEIQIRPRSGLAPTTIAIHNPQTVWSFPITKLTYGSCIIKSGECFAQCVISPILTYPMVTIKQTNNS